MHHHKLLPWIVVLISIKVKISRRFVARQGAVGHVKAGRGMARQAERVVGQARLGGAQLGRARQARRPGGAIRPGFPPGQRPDGDSA